ncbi:MAG: LUD domain-containing protein, partial [bacterium]
MNRFKQELDSLGVDYYFEDDREAVKRRIGSLLDGKSILSWDFDYLPYDAGAVLQGRSIQFCKNDRTEQAKADIGLTGCDAAIAETGSLVLISGEGKARTASLL